MRPYLAIALSAAAAAAVQSPTSTPEPAWVDLCDGTSLTGWEPHGGKADYRVEDGVLVGASVPGQPNGFLVCTREVADFELELELDLRVIPRLNSGVQIRSAVGLGGNGRDYV